MNYMTVIHKSQEFSRWSCYSIGERRYTYIKVTRGRRRSSSSILKRAEIRVNYYAPQKKNAFTAKMVVQDDYGIQVLNLICV